MTSRFLREEMLCERLVTLYWDGQHTVCFYLVVHVWAAFCSLLRTCWKLELIERRSTFYQWCIVFKSFYFLPSRFRLSPQTLHALRCATRTTVHSEERGGWTKLNSEMNRNLMKWNLKTSFIYQPQHVANVCWHFAVREVQKDLNLMDLVNNLWTNHSFQRIIGSEN